MAIIRNTTVVKPGPIGRIGRFVLGAISSSFVISILPFYSFFITVNPLNNSSPYFIGVLIAFLVLNDVVNIGFNVSWSRRPQAIFLALVVLAIALDLLLYGSTWGPPLGVVLFLMSILTHLYLGTSHILAALIATPGCEMRSIPHLVAKLRGSNIEVHVCPGHWDAVDKWETSS
jgi:hypothetical protein